MTERTPRRGRPSLHALAVALVLGAAAVVGTVALGRTLDLGSQARRSVAPPAAAIAARTHALDRFAAQLRRARRQRPPALPRIPKRPKTAVVPAAFAATASAQRVVYVRPTVVVRAHRSGGERADHEAGGGGDD